MGYAVLIWWLAGVASILWWITDVRDCTLPDFAGALLLGIYGPIILLVMVLVRSEHIVVFRKRKE